MTQPAEPSGESNHYVLQLFITGASPNSVRAVANLKKLCDAHIPEQYTLEVIDVHQQPELAQAEQIIALPMLIRRFPLPERRLIGDLSDSKRVVSALGLQASWP